MRKQIILQSLDMKNFKAIKELHLDFGDITNIYGDNGTGKTTIFDAENWLLFDKDSNDRTNFEIKTLDSNNQVIHGLEHEVTGVYLVDGKLLKLSKIHKEKWTKKKGEAERTLTGNETLYYIDDVPVKQSEYKDKISSLIDETLFKLITNPLHFSTNLKWQERRNIMLQIIGDVPVERILNYKSSLRGLEQLLSDKDIETLKKSIAARKKKLNDDIKSIPYRIDELNNSIKEYDFAALELQKQGLAAEIKSIEDQMMDRSKANEAVLKEKDKIYALKSKLRNIEFTLKIEAEKPLQELNTALRDVERELYDVQSKIRNVSGFMGTKETEITALERQMEDLRDEYKKVNSERFEMPEDSCICPTCHRPFEYHDVEAKKDELEGNFNQSKAKRLTQINAVGKQKKESVEKLRGQVTELKEELEHYNAKLIELQQQREERKLAVENFKPTVDLEGNAEYQEILKQISELEASISQPTEELKASELSQKKYSIQRELDAVNKQLAAKESNEEFKDRIAKLMEEEKSLAQQIAQLEGQEYLCEEFIKTKVELLENSINSKFKFVSFKLFNTLVNGAVEECCEALINGVPFSNANTASQINAGLDIINALCEHYGVSAPIFIDNRESVNEILECNSQIINLIVSNDPKLRIENKEREVA